MRIFFLSLFFLALFHTGDALDPVYVHFIKADDRPFNFMEYTAIRLAKERISGAIVLVHGTMPSPTKGDYWEKSKPLCQYLHIGPDISQRFSLFPGLRLAAHFSDVVRIEVLLKYGGIYLDFDVMTLRDMRDLVPSSDDNRNSQSLVVAWEKIVPTFKPVVGVAVLISRPGASLLRKWRDLLPTYFRTNCYTCHSTELLKELVIAHPNDVKILDWEHFYFPGWQENDADFLFSTAEENYEHTWQLFNVARAVHLFGSLLNPGERNGKWHDELSPRAVARNSTRFARLLGPQPIEI